MSRMVPGFAYRWLGYREVEIPGYHCGCCGSWHDEPRKVWRKRGLLRQWDTLGLCAKCCRSVAGVNFTLEELRGAFRRDTSRSRRHDSDHILFSERMRIAARVEAIVHLHSIRPDAMGIITALAMIDGLKRPSPWPTRAEQGGKQDEEQGGFGHEMEG